MASSETMNRLNLFSVCLIAASSPWSALSGDSTTSNTGTNHAYHIHANSQASFSTNIIAQAKAAGFQLVTFERLAGFTAETKQTATGLALVGQIPGEVAALSGKQVAIAGFMVPQKQRDGRVVEFHLVRSLSDCCGTGAPSLNELVVVRTDGKGVQPVTERPILAAGELVVGEYREQGELRAIYRLELKQLFNCPDKEGR